MNLKEMIISYIVSHYPSKKITVQNFESGCAIIDIDIPEKGKLIVVQAEPDKIGISMVEREPYLDFSLPDNVFYNLSDSISFLNNVLV